MNMLSFSMNQIRQYKITNASKKIHHRLPSTIEISNSQLFSNVSNAEHAFSYIPLIPARINLWYNISSLLSCSSQWNKLFTKILIAPSTTIFFNKPKKKTYLILLSMWVTTPVSPNSNSTLELLNTFGWIGFFLAIRCTFKHLQMLWYKSAPANKR